MADGDAIIDSGKRYRRDKLDPASPPDLNPFTDMLRKNEIPPGDNRRAKCFVVDPNSANPSVIRDRIEAIINHTYRRRRENCPRRKPVVKVVGEEKILNITNTQCGNYKSNRIYIMGNPTEKLINYAKQSNIVDYVVYEFEENEADALINSVMIDIADALKSITGIDDEVRRNIEDEVLERLRNNPDIGEYATSMSAFISQAGKIENSAHRAPEFKQAQQAHNERFRRTFRREPEQGTGEEYTAADHLHLNFIIPSGRNSLRAADIRKVDKSFYSVLSDYRVAYNKRNTDTKIDSLDTIFTRSWEAPEERVFGGQPDPLSGKASREGDRKRPRYGDEIAGFDALQLAYRDRFYEQHDRMPKRGANEDYTAIDFLNEVWGDMIEDGTLTGAIITKSDPDLYQAINNAVRYINRRNPGMALTLGDVFAHLDQSRRAVPADVAGPTTQISDIQHLSE